MFLRAVFLANDSVVFQLSNFITRWDTIHLDTRGDYTYLHYFCEPNEELLRVVEILIATKAEISIYP